LQSILPIAACLPPEVEFFTLPLTVSIKQHIAIRMSIPILIVLFDPSGIKLLSTTSEVDYLISLKFDYLISIISSLKQMKKARKKNHQNDTDLPLRHRYGNYV